MEPRLDACYRILQVAPNASMDEIKRSARRLFLQHHPDINPQNRAYCEEKTKALTEAYHRILQDRRSRSDGIAEATRPSDEAVEQPEERADNVVFALSQRLFAFPAARVKKIVRVKDVRLENINMVSEAFPFIAGLFSYEGEMVMLWNLYRQLALREPPIDSDVERRQVIVVNADDSSVGFLVEGVHGIMPLDNVCRVMKEEGDTDSHYIDGISVTEDGPVGLLNLHNILYSY